MSNLEQAKIRLQEAMTKLEVVIQKRLLQFEIENNSLKAEISRFTKETSSKQETNAAVTSSKKKGKEDKALDLINAKTSNEVDLSLNELKRLVR